MQNIVLLDDLRCMLDEAQTVVVFTGAGISTESGIPDFRSPGTGLWNNIKPVEFQDFISSDKVRQESWHRRFSGEREMDIAKPNKGHEAIAKLVAERKVIGVITQNIDNLFQDSGIPNNQVVELHGNARYAKCLSCDKRYEMTDLENQWNRDGRVEPCSRCGGLIKSATISFGQSMPEDAMLRAQEYTENSDLMLTIGSTLIVYPAAEFPKYAKERGAKLVILNREATPLDDIADLVIHDEIGPVMSYVVGIN
jgi:NAD-dependent deacetylase